MDKVIIEDGFARVHTEMPTAHQRSADTAGAEVARLPTCFEITHRAQSNHRIVPASEVNAREKRWRKEWWPSITGKQIKEESK